jgi:hypothetical protein
MSPWLNEFLSDRLPLPRVAAWGTRLADGSVASHSYQSSLPEPRIKQAVLRLAKAAEGLAQHKIQPRRLRWTFELATIHVGLRPDGICLVIFLENAPAATQAQIQAILEDFLKLQAV